MGDDKTFRYTVRDGDAIHAWVREHYSSSGELTSVPEVVDNDATGTRPSQRQREPSRKATFLQKEKGKEKQKVSQTYRLMKLSRLSKLVKPSYSGRLSELE